MDLEAWAKRASNGSASVRAQAIEDWSALEGEAQAEIAVVLLGAPYKEVREAVLEYAQSEVVSQASWRRVWEKGLQTASGNDLLCANMLVVMGRMVPLSERMARFVRERFSSADGDVRYQAFCAAEYQEMTDEAYVAQVRKWLEDSDEDMRIVAVQAITRLKPEWGEAALTARYGHARGMESFLIRMALVRMTSGVAHDGYAAQLLRDVRDDRYSFAAIEAIGTFGRPENSALVAEAIAVLLKVARRIWEEPTVRVAAAAAAARLGAKDGAAMLKKFASSRHGNPMYARMLADTIELP